MVKKFAKIICSTFVALSATALNADGQIETSTLYNGGFTLGLTLNATSLGATEPYLTFGYINNCFLVDVGFNYKYLNFDDYHKSISPIVGHLGLRNRVFQNLFVTYGVSGDVLVGRWFDGEHPYSVGAFTGLDLQITRHFLLSAKINPYNFQHLVDGVNFNEVFASGSIGLSYVF